MSLNTIRSTAPLWFPSNIKALNERFEAEPTENLLSWATAMLGDALVMSTGFGPSGIVLMHMLSKIRPWTTVFYLETDLHFAETHTLKEELSGRLGIRFETIHSGLSLHDQSKRFGPKLWQSEPSLCCHLRKVMPLQKYLVDKRGWITGIRRDQSPTRANTKVISWDETHQLLKLAPLAFWTNKQVWDYIKNYGLPYNSLHDKGFPSIGCFPCTHAASDPNDERSGRWAGQQKTECGIHLKLPVSTNR
ncbi:MAG: phosphoadenylyl-sulfate reductase [Chloroflexota bacterium]